MDDRTDGSTDRSTPERSPQGEPRDATRDTRQEGFATAHAAEQNRLLAALPLAEYARLLPRLVPVRLGLKQGLVEPDAPIRDVYFPRDGVCSVIAVEQEGGPIEVGTVGRDGFVGLPVLLAADRMPYRVFVQVEGHAWRSPAEEFRQITDERPAGAAPAAALRAVLQRPSLAVGGVQPPAHARRAVRALAADDARPGGRRRVRAHARVPVDDARRTPRGRDGGHGHPAGGRHRPVHARAGGGARPPAPGGGELRLLPHHPHGAGRLLG
jgi:hypothetical protein